ncbi:MAG: protein kinase [Acidobacteria bacterium]|nr:protein kinase [Acidobacteriota bacterium]
MQSQPPPNIGQYQIIRELGRGGMGVVYLGYDPGIARQVAIKTILLPQSTHGPDPTSSEKLKTALLREARAAGGLAHPNIVTVHQMGEQDGMLYLVMEYLTGGSLEDRLTEGQPIHPDWTVFALEQVAAALDYAHAAGFVHRDIKPGNILLATEQADRVKIADFGLARVVDSSQSLDRIAGTPSYMSPEQVNGEKLNGASDQFALAQMAYRLLTGRTAFVADDYRSLLTQIVASREVPAHVLNPRLHPQVSMVLSRGLAKMPHERYFNCRDLISNLRLALEGRAPVAHVQPPVPQEVLVFTPAPQSGQTAADPKPGGTPPWIALTMAALGLAFGVGTVWLLISKASREKTEIVARKSGDEITPPRPAPMRPTVTQNPTVVEPPPPPSSPTVDAPTVKTPTVEGPKPARVDTEPASPPKDKEPPVDRELTTRLSEVLRNRNTSAGAVQDLLSRGAGANGFGDRRPIVDAARSCNEEAVKLLLSKGANPNQLGDSDRSALEALLTYVNTSQSCPNALAVAKLLLDAGAKPNGSQYQGRDVLSPPWQAAMRGVEWRPILDLLLAKGADPTMALPAATDPRVGRKEGDCNTPVVEMLLAKGAKVEGWNKLGEPLRNAAKSACPDNVRLLLARGANPASTSPDVEGKNALQLAVRVQSPRAVDTVRTLLEGGADPFAVDAPFQGREAPKNTFEEAYIYCRVPQVFNVLFDSVRDLRKTDRNGRTLLHVVARDGKAEEAQKLIERGAPLNIRDKDGMTPLGRANRATAKVLEAAGAAK